MSKYRSMGIVNFLLGAFSICLPLLIYAYIMKVQTEKFFINIIFNLPNQTLLKVLIFNAFLGIITFSMGLLSLAVSPQSTRKYFTDNCVLAITAFLFLSVVLIYTYYLVKGTSF